MRLIGVSALMQLPAILSDTWKASVSGKDTVNRESPENWYPSVSNGHEKKDALNLPVTAS